MWKPQKSQLPLQPALGPGVVAALEEGKKKIEFWEVGLERKIKVGIQKWPWMAH